MEIMDALGCFNGHSSSLFPVERKLNILNVGPERSSRAEFKNDCEIGRFGAGSKEHDDIGVP